ncbi:MAG TPA: 3-oxoacyl-[acyl-carrier-protein] reductase [bacterium]|jgi:3-oxoacyl-[acyl-carrier protein] reductase
MSFKSKVAVITGGASGIGAGIARAFAREQARVAICDIDANTGAKTASEIGAAARFFELDITNEDNINNAINTIMSDYGQIDVLVNNAGITNDRLILRMTAGDWDKVLKINLTGTFLMTKAVSKHMLKQRSGRIINIASVIGLTGNAGQANYAASKAGIIGFTKSCAKEFAPRNITVNAIAPGFIQTRMTDVLSDDAKNSYIKLIPLGRFGTPDDVAQVTLFLASDAASYITGQVLCLDGGMVM